MAGGASPHVGVRRREDGRFNLVQGALATAVGIGAALSTSSGGKLIQLYGYRTSFLARGAVAAIAFTLLWVLVPEILASQTETDADSSFPRDQFQICVVPDDLPGSQSDQNFRSSCVFSAVSTEYHLRSLA
jgi:MFS family permease